MGINSLFYTIIPRRRGQGSAGVRISEETPYAFEMGEREEEG